MKLTLSSAATNFRKRRHCLNGREKTKRSFDNPLNALTFLHGHLSYIMQVFWFLYEVADRETSQIVFMLSYSP